MRIAIELPTWLGDCIMTTPAVMNIVKELNYPEVIFIGNEIALSVYLEFPNVYKNIQLEKKLFDLYKTSKKAGKVEYFISFRSSQRSLILKTLINSKNKFQYNKYKYSFGHQVEKYNNFVKDIFQSARDPGKLEIFNKISTNNYKKKTIGINPGASYGDAKRWYPEKFAEVAVYFSKSYDILILGGQKEINIDDEIEQIILMKKVKNCINLAGKTSINDLYSAIASVSLFVTGDSGPMHIAAALNIPTITIFGPTKNEETCQWKNKQSANIKLNLPCQPCMKRT